MQRKTIENITAQLTVIMLFIMTFGGIIFAADLMFAWNLFPPRMETFIYFLLTSCMLIIIASVLVNIMINFSILALSVEELAEKYNNKKDYEK